MPTLSELFEFEEQLEAGFSAMLDPVTTNVYYRRSTESKATPYLDVLVTVGQQFGHKKALTGAEEDDLFTGTLQVEVNTLRSTTGQNTAHHALLGAVRKALLPVQGGYNSTNFPNIAVLDITPSGSSYEIDAETNIDTTMLAYDFYFGIRDTVWATVDGYEIDNTFADWSEVATGDKNVLAGTYMAILAFADGDGVEESAFVPTAGQTYEFSYNVNALDLDGATSLDIGDGGSNLVRAVTTAGTYVDEITVPSGGWNGSVKILINGTPSSGASISITNFQIRNTRYANA